MRKKIGRLEQDLASANRELDRMRARPATATERENYGHREPATRKCVCMVFIVVERDSCAVAVY